MNLRFASWPFPVNMPAHLYWIKSPMQVGKDKQWRSKVLFIGDNGRCQEDSHPWGTIQLLKLGCIYVNGSIAPTPAAGELRTVSFSDKARCELISAEGLNNPWADRVRQYRTDLLWEKCAVIEDNGCKVFVPCIEIIRAFFAINKELAHRLLEPNGLTNICTTTLDKGVVSLHFNHELPLNALNDAVASRIATVLHHRQWQDRWQQVWHGSQKKSSLEKVYTKLSCLPPIMKNSRWHLRGIETAEGFFVLEIMGVKTTKISPFSTVTYTHPNLTAPQQKAPPLGTVPVPDSDIEATIDDSLAPPKDLGRPYSSEIQISLIEFGRTVRVLRIRSDESDEMQRGDRRTARPDKSATGPDKVSLNDEAGVGEVPAGEFLPIDQLENIPACLQYFIEAVKQMPEPATAECVIDTVPDSSPLAKVGNSPCTFALVHVTYNHVHGFLLEVDAANGHKISTIALMPKGPISLLELVNHLLTECLAGQGHWSTQSLDEIKKLHLLKYEFAKHTTTEPKHWGRRLLGKIIVIASRYN